MEVRDHAARDVDAQRQPGSLEWLAVLPINDDEVDPRVVDLNDLKRPLGDVLPRNRTELIASGLRPLARLGELGGIDSDDPGMQRMPAWRLQFTRTT
jgi:hypothetical protein